MEYGNHSPGHSFPRDFAGGCDMHSPIVTDSINCLMPFLLRLSNWRVKGLRRNTVAVAKVFINFSAPIKVQSKGQCVQMLTNYDNRNNAFFNWHYFSNSNIIMVKQADYFGIEWNLLVPTPVLNDIRNVPTRLLGPEQFPLYFNCFNLLVTEPVCYV